MTKNIVTMAAALLGAGALMTGCNLDQPTAGCIVQDSSWAAKYDVKQITPDNAECQDVAIPGEVLGVFKFADPETAGKEILTLRPQTLYRLAARDGQYREGKPEGEENSNFAQTAYASLGSEPDAQDFCSTQNWVDASVAVQPYSEDPDAAEGQIDWDAEPVTVITYKFDNVKVYSAPDAPGTQLSGDLTVTQDGCSVSYGVRAIWPPVGCDPEETNPALNCGEGSGINPDFAVTCDPDLGFCVPSKPIPSFTVDR